MATLDAQDVRDTASNLAGRAGEAALSAASSVGDTLTGTVLPKVAEVTSNIASTAAEKAEAWDDVDKSQLKRWWPVAAVIGLLVAVGVIHRKRRDAAAQDAPGKH